MWRELHNFFFIICYRNPDISNGENCLLILIANKWALKLVVLLSLKLLCNPQSRLVQSINFNSKTNNQQKQFARKKLQISDIFREQNTEKKSLIL